MAVNLKNWGVVVAAHWNRAITTPEWVTTNLFGLAEGTPIEIEVPIDAIAPYRVFHNDLMVVCSSSSVIVEVRKEPPTLAILESAMKIAAKAVEELPRTPFHAVGINVRFNADDADAAELSEFFTSTWDDNASAEQLVIGARTLSRAIKWNEGNVNLVLEENEGVKVLFNIERKSKIKGEHLAWLQRPIAEIRAIVETLLKTIGFQDRVNLDGN